jgi:tRNA(adenine34) deaminase
MNGDADYMSQALELAATALAAGEFPVGCVLVCDGRVVAGAARTGSAGRTPSELDHAEMIALRRMQTRKPPLDPARVTAYCNMEPCLMCFAALILTGVRRIVFAYEDVMGGGAAGSRKALAPLYRDAAVQVTGGVLRAESLSLFKAFFSNPSNFYWRESLLARYTLQQR